jgi:2-polyprenyl-3-methyl-5-hydroxy-6-metoxy-1,4-benzoquinol methylase
VVFGGVNCKIDEKILNDFWYYTVELPDGRFTPGQNFNNIALTRNLLKAAKVEGSRCFDWGTTEALVPTLLAKRGARQVVAVDVRDYSEKVELVKSWHRVQFEYYSHILSDNTVAFAKSIGDRFDIVVLSGILYHVFSPVHLLGYARSLARLGGLVIIETAAILDQAYTMQYNWAIATCIIGRILGLCQYLCLTICCASSVLLRSIACSFGKGMHKT